LTLTGGLYEERVLEQFLRAVAGWSRIREGCPCWEIELIYAGADGGRFRRYAGLVNESCRVTVNDYLTLEDFARLCRGASLNAYLGNPRAFHHKLMELLASGRPVLAFPGESDESMKLARDVGGDLVVAQCIEEIHEALNRVARNGGRRGSSVDLVRRHYSWDAQAVHLERCLTVAQDASGG